MAAKDSKATDEQIIAALIKRHGILTYAANDLGMARQSLYARMEKSEMIRLVYESCSEAIVDLAEGNLVRVLQDQTHPDNYRASEFIAVTKGKGRGYTKRSEVTGANGSAFTVEFVPADG